MVNDPSPTVPAENQVSPPTPSTLDGRSLAATRCARFRPVFRDPQLSVLSFECLEDGQDLRTPRRHEGLVVSWLFRGSFVSVSRGRSLVADASRVLVSLPGTVFTTEHPLGVRDAGWKIGIGDALAEELMGRWLPSAWERVTAGHSLSAFSVPLPVHSVLPRIVAESSTGPEPAGPEPAGPEPMAFEELLLWVLEDVISRGRSISPPGYAEPTSGQREIARATQLLLVERFRETVRLTDLARELGCSSAHLGRVFRAVTGLPVYRYLKYLRLLAVLDRLMQCPCDPLDRIAVDAGFYSHSHMATAFRQVFDLAPSEIRHLVARDRQLRLREWIETWLAAADGFV